MIDKREGSGARVRLTRPYFDAAETDAVARVLASGMLVQGAEVRRFEAAMEALLVGVSPARGPVHAVAVNNGTSALELALMAGGVGAGDEVLVPALTWPSPGNAVLLRAAVPVLVDVSPEDFNLDPALVPELLTPRTRALIAVDQFGVPALLPELTKLAGGLTVIEDAACALGSSLNGAPCGLMGSVGTLSFHPRKVITTGEGGMLLTHDPRQADTLRALRNHGQELPGIFRAAGPNARLTEFQAAIGLVQLAKLGEILARRREISQELRSALALHWQGAPAGAVVNDQTLGFVLPEPASGSRVEARNALITALRELSIEAGYLSYGLHRLPQFASHAVNKARRFPVTDAVVDGGVAVPLHPGLTRADVNAVIDALREHAAWALGRPVFPVGKGGGR